MALSANYRIALRKCKYNPGKEQPWLGDLAAGIESVRNPSSKRDCCSSAEFCRRRGIG